MRVYEITIKPVTPFGTPLKGDTVFGHVCWQSAYDEQLLGRSVNDLLHTYDESPFAVFSTAYPKFRSDNQCRYAFKTPDLPAEKLMALPEDRRLRLKLRKEVKAKRWMILDGGKTFTSFADATFLSDEDLYLMSVAGLDTEREGRARPSTCSALVATVSQSHNTINRLTNSTGSGKFAPFVTEVSAYCQGTELVLFAGVDENVVNIQQICTALERVGSVGFGRDASAGLGRFDVGQAREVDLALMGSSAPNCCYTLGPSVPERESYADMFFSPFTRFGRHGDVLSKSSNPFKNPVIMADEGAVFKPLNSSVFRKPFIGTAVRNVSVTEPRTVVQGFALYLPVTVEE